MFLEYVSEMHPGEIRNTLEAKEEPKCSMPRYQALTGMLPFRG